MKRIIKTGLWSICIMAVICIALLLICNQIVVHNAKGKVFSELDSIAPTEWGLLLGTTPQTRIGIPTPPIPNCERGHPLFSVLDELRPYGGTEGWPAPTKVTSKIPNY